MRIWSALALLCWSMCLDVSAAFSAEESDYNFSWLDPEKKIYVLQNRRYRKAGSPELYAMGGLSLGDPYRTVMQVQPRFGFWFTESMGLEVFYSARFHSVNNSYLAVVDAVKSGGNTPYIREVKSQFGALFNWAPWYAKINVFNSILYFDWYFSMGGGVMSTDIGPKTKDDPSASAFWTQENLFAVFLGTGQMFYLDEHWTARLDFLGHFYSANIYGGYAGASSEKAIYSNFSLNLGIGYKI